MLPFMAVLHDLVNEKSEQPVTLHALTLNLYSVPGFSRFAMYIKSYPTYSGSSPLKSSYRTACLLETRTGNHETLISDALLSLACGANGL